MLNQLYVLLTTNEKKLIDNTTFCQTVFSNSKSQNNRRIVIISSEEILLKILLFRPCIHLHFVGRRENNLTRPWTSFPFFSKKNTKINHTYIYTFYTWTNLPLSLHWNELLFYFIQLENEQFEWLFKVDCILVVLPYSNISHMFHSDAMLVEQEQFGGGHKRKEPKYFLKWLCITQQLNIC